MMMGILGCGYAQGICMRKLLYNIISQNEWYPTVPERVYGSYHYYSNVLSTE